MTKSILYVENDSGWEDLIVPELERYGAVIYLESELAFRETIDGMVHSGLWPSVALLDQRLRWTFPDPQMQARPQDVTEGGFWNAGVRCYDYLREKKSDFRIPVLFYTIDVEEIPLILRARGVLDDFRDYQCVEKNASFKGLRQALNKILE